MEMHAGKWDKSAINCHEVRGMTLGIVGYGHIGTQLSVLAESLGMRVIFYDIEKIMPIGNSKPCSTLQELLQNADFVTLHVPQTEMTREMIGEQEIQMMKRGSYLLNASRGNVVVLSALEAALKSGHLAGAAVDVYPTEPESNINDWQCMLKSCSNVILTPHIGGSTEEAQYTIGVELADKIVRLINTGSTVGTVNFPALDLPVRRSTHRILSIHKNQPGVLRDINSILAEVNVSGQILGTTEHIGYLIVDVDQETSADTKKAISNLPSSLRTRILY
jgi:D-3-phosphoglycerate dehydrogenase